MLHRYLHLSDSAESVGQEVGRRTVEYLKAPPANYCPRFFLLVPPRDCDITENGDISSAIRYVVPDVSPRLGQTSSGGSLYSPTPLYLLCNWPLEPFKILHTFR